MADEPKTYTQAEVDTMVADQVKGLAAKNTELLGEVKRTKKALEAWDGKDPAKYDQLATAAEEAERKKAAAEGDFTTLRNQLVEKHGTELAGRDATISKQRKALERRLVDAELTRAIAAKKGDPDLLLPYARQFVRVKETDDDFEGYIADERGNPLVADGKGTPMDFGMFVEQTLMVKFPRAFDGTGSSGGGAAKSNAGGVGTRSIPASGLDMAGFGALVGDIASGKTDVT